MRRSRVAAVIPVCARCDFIVIASSTDAKSRVMKLADGDVACIDDFSIAIDNEFCAIEKAFCGA